MNFSEIIKKVNSNEKLIPDLMKSEKGNNFRAISESAILDVIDPILKEAGWFYTVHINDHHLEIKEAYGSKGKKLQFIATLSLTICFYDDNKDYQFPIFTTEAVGMGIDDNDKAMGKAYTYAVKYALLKLFRLRYGDDPDAKASEPLYLDKPKDNNSEEKHEKKSHTKSKQEESKEKLMTEAQKEYIMGLMKKKGVLESTIIGKFHVEPSFDQDIPMKTARAIISYLEEEDDLPF